MDCCLQLLIGAVYYILIVFYLNNGNSMLNQSFAIWIMANPDNGAMKSEKHGHVWREIDKQCVHFVTWVKSYKLTFG